MNQLRLLTLMCVGLTLAMLVGCGSSQPVAPRFSGLTFPDPELDTAVRRAILKPTGSIMPADVADLRWFSAARYGVMDLTGIEKLTALRSLDLSSNRIEDLAPLSGLRSLELLYLNNNLIRDVSALSPLTSLITLDLSGNGIESVAALGSLHDLQLLYMNGNRIEDLSPLSSLTLMEILYLSNNQIVDIGPLMDLVSLVTLYLSSNQIEDITALGKLTSLDYLSLFENQVTEIGVLVANPGIGTFDTVVLTGNLLSEHAITVQVPALEARRVTVIVTPDNNILGS